jgi:hypothetical protein
MLCFALLCFALLCFAFVDKTLPDKHCTYILITSVSFKYTCSLKKTPLLINIWLHDYIFHADMIYLDMLTTRATMECET